MMQEHCESRPESPLRSSWVCNLYIHTCKEYIFICKLTMVNNSYLELLESPVNRVIKLLKGRKYNAKQKQPGCKKSARPIRSHNGYK